MACDLRAMSTCGKGARRWGSDGRIKRVALGTCGHSKRRGGWPRGEEIEGRKPAKRRPRGVEGEWGPGRSRASRYGRSRTGCHGPAKRHPRGMEGEGVPGRSRASRYGHSRTGCHGLA
jgi:hypothetical protein